LPLFFFSPEFIVQLQPISTLIYPNINYSTFNSLLVRIKFTKSIFVTAICYAEQVIAGRIHARTGSSYIGMAMNGMHTLTSLLLLNQLQHHILWLLGGYVILLQVVKESRWCEILSRKIIEHVSFLVFGFSTILPVV
jgi:hypothetical protein